jgi:hypothetical protein
MSRLALRTINEMLLALTLKRNMGQFIGSPDRQTLMPFEGARAHHAP